MLTEKNQDIQQPDIDDAKEIAGRTTKLSYVALLFVLFNMIVSYKYGNYISVLILGSLLVCLIFLIFIGRLGLYSLTQILGIILINSFLILLNFAEGRKSGVYTYFLPVLFSIPFMVTNSKKYVQEISVYFSITILAALACIFLVPDITTWQNISPYVYQRNFFINTTACLLLTAAFSYLIIQTDRRYKYALLQEKNKAEEAALAKTRFLSNIGYELRTPLNGIIGTTNILEQQPFFPEQTPYIKVLHYCSNHLLNLVNDILDFNSILADTIELQLAPASLPDLLRQSAILFEEKLKEKHIELLFEIDDQLDSLVNIDEVRFMQVISNLLSNAVKFTEKGFVKIKMLVVDETPDVATVKVTVEDSGIGINEENISKIFQNFWQAYNDSTRKYRGTGLGLSISQHLLQLMDSEMKVESIKEVGSKFYFTTTFTKFIQDPATMPKKPKAFSDMSDLTILIGEDNVINMMLVKKMLEDKNATVIAAYNGREVVKELETDTKFDVLLLDLEMPEMDGYATMEYIKAHKKYTLPVIAFTAILIDNSSYNNLLGLGFKDCIFKPFRPEDLFDTIKKSVSPQPTVDIKNIGSFFR